MPISDAAINALPIGKDVYDDLTFCFQQWQLAGYKAVQALDDPKDEDSTLDWVISLVGNLAWAATVFFPPSWAIAAVGTVGRGGVLVAGKVVYASASAATKATSMIGATLAAGVVPKLRNLGGKLTSPQGKLFLDRYLNEQVPDLLKEYAKEADPWSKKDLVNRLISQYSLRFKPDPKANNDAAFTAFYNSVAGGEERRRYVWDEFVFPGGVTSYDNQPSRKGGLVGLQDYLGSQLSDALKDFDRQWTAYLHKISYSAGRYRQIRQEYVGRIPPFDPVLSFIRVPSKVHVQQEANRRNLKSFFPQFASKS